MTETRRSIFLSSLDRFFAMFIKFATLMVTARLLTPAELGVAVLGTAAYGIAGIVRDFGGNAYLVQIDDATPERVQTVFTILLVLTLPLSLLCIVLAQPLADFYATPGLKDYMWVTSACFLLGPFSSPIFALLRRRFAFGQIAVINAATSIGYGLTTIVLALAGYGYMSVAWAGLASAALNLALSFYWHPDFKIYRLSLHDWRRITEYGMSESARNMLYYLGDNVPLLAFGKFLGPESVGLFQRAWALSSLPSTTLLAGAAQVMLPAFSKHARDGQELKDSYLISVEYVTALLWPSTLLIIILAQPIVLVLLGRQWVDAVPLVQIMSAAFLIWFPMYVTNPILIAAGGIRDTLVLALITIPVTVTVQCVAGYFGLAMAALSYFITVPFYICFSVLMVRRRVPFEWVALLAALKRSAIVSFFSAIGPFVIVVLSGGPYAVSIAQGSLGCVTAFAGWLIGLRVAGHPMLREVQKGSSLLLDYLPETVTITSWLQTAKQDR